MCRHGTGSRDGTFIVASNLLTGTSIMNGTILTLAALLLGFAYTSTAQTPHRGGISFNSDYVRTLETTMDLGNTVEVFRHVFSSLDSEIYVYPTEGYYYFSFNANGAKINGNIGFFADLRGRGLINFAYYEDSGLRELGDDVAWYNEDLDEAGVELEEIDSFTYLLSFEGRTVRVRLNDIARPATSRLVLDDGEEYVGTTFDESGLSFYLVFDALRKHLFWVLNEDITVNESFASHGDEIVIGRRTGFAFYDDTLRGRLVLFGVASSNVERNTLFDGPFDQLPDSYVYDGQLDLRRYLEAAYPFVAGHINEYGIYLKRKGSRIAVCSYLVYGRTNELTALLNRCRAQAGSTSELVAALTREG
jgi:hypothetical protein